MSRETAALIAFFRASGVPGRVTDIDTPRIHADTSLHYAAGTEGRGRAVDFAGPIPGRDSDSLLAIYKLFRPLAEAGVLVELYYSGPGGGLWKRGFRISSAAVAAAHHNHVHVSVPLGWQWHAPKEAPMPDEKPRYKVNAAPVGIAITPSGHGYVILCADGGVITFGDAEFHGTVEPPAPK